MIDSTGYNWLMNEIGLEVMRLAPFKRKIKVRGKRKYIIRYKVIWNPFLKTEYLGGTK